MADDTSVGQDNSQQPVDWEGRYKGASRKIQELTEALRAQNEQLTSSTSKLVGLEADLNAEKQAAQMRIGASESRLQELNQQLTQSQSEISRLKALEAKVKAVTELGRPELIAIAGTIPDSQDSDAIKNSLKAIIDFTDSQVRLREKQLSAGVTEPAQSLTPQLSLPTTADEWQKYVNEAKPGSEEKAKRFDAWRDWGMKQGR